MSSPVLGGRWDDVQLLTVARTVGGVSAVSAGLYRGGLYLLEFTQNQTKELYGSIELPHDYMEGTSLVLHVHWATNSTDATGGGVRWECEYSLANPTDGSAETYTASVQSTQTVAAGNRQYTTNSFDIATITNVGGTISTLFSFTIRRLGTDGADTYPVSAFIKSFALHIQKDTIGSNGQNTKN